MYREPKDEKERLYNIDLYNKCLIAIKMPIHKRMEKEKFRKNYDINEMLDHLFDLFHLIGKELASANFSSITKNCQKTIMKFSKKLKHMIKKNGDFYLPRSRSPSKENSRSQNSRKQSFGTMNMADSKIYNNDMINNSNEVVMNNSQFEESKILSA